MIEAKETTSARRKRQEPRARTSARDGRVALAVPRDRLGEALAPRNVGRVAKHLTCAFDRSQAVAHVAFAWWPVLRPHVGSKELCDRAIEGVDRDGFACSD